jgi:patatin-related protein
VNSAEHIAFSQEDPSASAQQPFQPRREIRFAVVMYGGVSLAIYINGVAQELLDMVRATATVPTEATKDKENNEEKEWEPLIKDELPGAMAVYRKLGQYLGLNREQRKAKLREDTVSTTDPIRTQFVVDIISGTSAGGINGVFLAKALARNQNMGGLKQLWLSEGDLGKLLNDKHSMGGVAGFNLKEPQQSLLNSQRMYYKLLQALDDMDEGKNHSVEDSPLVRELDLFVTTTDIEGLPLPIDLFDDVVYERRYKNVFHFRYASEETTGTRRDDFTKANDPFLAFAARCTSSFPFAFEAMRLCDITAIAKAYKADPPYSDQSATTAEWDKFFSDYLRNSLFDLDLTARDKDATGNLPGTGTLDEKLSQAEKDLRESFRKRSFGDGGYLDNKPFSHATSLLTRRFADCAVDRKLIYVEPSPEHPELTAARVDPPDFAENVRAAALDLPRQETIREDLDRVYERNVLLERIGILAREVDADLEIRQIAPLAGPEFENADLNYTVKHYGVTYGAYHRLRVAEVTMFLSELIARMAGHDPTSDAAVAIRELVGAWRRAFYQRDKPQAGDEKNPTGGPKQTENKFLVDFDIRYDLRRQAFLNRRINQLIELDPDAQIFLAAVAATKDWPNGVKLDEILGPEREAFQKELNRIKRLEVAPVLKSARSAEEKLLDKKSPIGKELCDKIGELRIGWPQLEEILKCDRGQQREEKAKNILLDPNANRHGALSDLAKIICRGLKTKATTTPPPGDATAKGTLAARASIKHYRDKFILYDLVIYPVQYATAAGESSVVDVFRVSPEDAETLMKEPADKTQGTKLAGRTLMSFGAFLDESWRRNDMLWGRLDGAERIIRALLPNRGDRDLRKELTRKAHRAILEQEVEKEKNLQAVCGVLSNALANRETQDDHGAEVSKVVQQIRDKYEKEWSTERRQDLTNGRKLDRHLPPQQSLQYISRSTNIVGNMFSGLAETKHLPAGQRFGSWLARFGTILWNVVAVAVPDNLASLFFRHWLSVLYVFDAVMILVGGVLDKDMNAFGWKALGVTLAVHLTVLGVRFYISEADTKTVAEKRRPWWSRQRKHWLLWMRLIVAVPTIALLVCGGIYVADALKTLHFGGRLLLAGGTSAVVLALVAIGEWKRIKLVRGARTATEKN